MGASPAQLKSFASLCAGAAAFTAVFALADVVLAFLCILAHLCVIEVSQAAKVEDYSFIFYFYTNYLAGGALPIFFRHWTPFPDFF